MILHHASQRLLWALAVQLSNFMATTAFIMLPQAAPALHSSAGLARNAYKVISCILRVLPVLLLILLPSDG
jgi:hypothetical protein